MTELRCGTCGQRDEDVIYREGFDACMEMILSVFQNSPEKESESLLEEIIESHELYLKDG